MVKEIPVLSSLVVVKNLEALSKVSTKVHIVGVHHVSSNLKCPSCNRKTQEGDNEKSVYCEKCDLHSLAKHCEKSWFARIMVSDDTTRENVHLNLFDEAIAQLFKCCKIIDKKEYEVAALILSIEKPLSITYDSIESKVLYISLDA